MRSFCICFWQVFGFALLFTACQKSTVLHVSGSADNDLISVLTNQSNIELKLYATPEEVLPNVKEGDGVLVLSQEYPNQREKLSTAFYETLKTKQIRAYIEFPASLPGVELGAVESAKAERAVVNTTFFSPGVDSLQILGINGLQYIQSSVDQSWMVASKVAGFDSAVYGITEGETPLLFQWQEQPVLISTTNLSQFITGRYAPQQEWAHIWQSILSYILPSTEIQKFEWTPTVSPMYGKEEELPQDVQEMAVRKGIEWYREARMLVPNQFEDVLQAILEKKEQKMAWQASIPYGDGSEGVFECIFSEIDEDGRQPIGIIKRGDCISETAMAFATAASLFQDTSCSNTAENLLDFYFEKSIAFKGEYGDPQHPAYGLIPWGISNYAWYKAVYGDDNARFLLGAMTTAALTGLDHWDEKMMKALVALLRTTGTKGFRGSRVNVGDYEEKGWKYYQNRDNINLSPHFEAYVWACYLWAYDKTNDPIFLEKAKLGIDIMMDHYPNGWRWTNGLAQERARMILPLAWLVRVEDTAENRAMLLQVVKDFLQLQDESGAIREELGSIEMGKYPPPKSNADYGTNEASLIAQNGDPVSDLLYTTNFAFLGLHEAQYATQDPSIKEATDRLAEFLCRIQVKSEKHPELHGGWMRAFDYERFEHWGSNADHGWGAWAIETGWTQGWITTILGLRSLDTSIWTLTADSDIGQYYPALKRELLK